jgi:pimeloyl-ACP methyl ester carboxylesterase
VELPFDAQVMPASEKRFRETVVFVHHFGGSRRTVLRHLKMVNVLGFDAVRYDLVFNALKLGEPLPITPGLKFGACHVWIDELESILNAIPGRKIIYSFSMPSLAALGAIARRKANDISGWICDGGPFLQLLRCTYNLLEHEYHVENPLLRAFYSAAAYPLFGTGIELAVRSWGSQLPDQFPVLSVRGEKDPLVPISAIEDVFAFTPQIELQRLSLKDGGHLDGLKKFPDVYEPTARAFLTRIGTSI